MKALEMIHPQRRRRGLLLLALLLLVIPALHPLLRPAVGVPSHLLWFAHILPVAVVAYEFGLRGAGAAVLVSILWVSGGEHLFGAGYGIAADEATVLALSTAVGLTNALVAGFALWVRAEQARRRDLAQLVAAALSASPEAVIVLDGTQRIQYANDAARRLFEARPGQLRGLSFDALLGEEAQAQVARLLEIQAADRAQVVARTTGGRPFAAELSASPVRDGQRMPIACLVTVRDQSERLRREQADRRTQSLSELGATIASIAHELNNPLSAVIAYADLLREWPGFTGQAAEDVHVITHEARRAAGIARQLLNVVRSGERPRETVDLRRLVERTLKSRAASFAAHGIRLSFASGAGQWPVFVVPGEIEQVVVNLLANAEQAMHGERGEGSLRVSLRRAGGHVELEIADDGPGIPPEHLPRLFEAFFTTKPVGVGTGLGLSIARRIARDHGGDLTVAATEGRGAAFTLRLPAASAAQLTIEPRPPVPRKGSAAPKRILVVDDEPALRQSVARILQRGGVEAIAVANAEDALRQLDTTAFDLVLCDVHLGDRSGIDVYQTAVRRDPGLQGRFVFMTGDVLSLELREFFASAHVRHLPKPFELTELFQEVERGAAA